MSDGIEASYGFSQNDWQEVQTFGWPDIQRSFLPRTLGNSYEILRERNLDWVEKLIFVCPSHKSWKSVLVWWFLLSSSHLSLPPQCRGYSALPRELAFQFKVILTQKYRHTVPTKHFSCRMLILLLQHFHLQISLDKHQDRREPVQLHTDSITKTSKLKFTLTWHVLSKWNVT